MRQLVVVRDKGRLDQALGFERPFEPLIEGDDVSAAGGFCGKLDQQAAGQCFDDPNDAFETWGAGLANRGDRRGRRLCQNSAGAEEAFARFSARASRSRSLRRWRRTSQGWSSLNRGSPNSSSISPISVLSPSNSSRKRLMLAIKRSFSDLRPLTIGYSRRRSTRTAPSARREGAPPRIGSQR